MQRFQEENLIFVQVRIQHIRFILFITLSKVVVLLRYDTI